MNVYNSNPVVGNSLLGFPFKSPLIAKIEKLKADYFDETDHDKKKQLPPTEGELVVTLEDTLCRFLTVGDVDGDGKKEMIAATSKSGLWLLRPHSNGPWDKELIDAGSGGFEHASILLDLDGDKRDELYVASDNQKEVRRYDWTPKGWRHACRDRASGLLSKKREICIERSRKIFTKPSPQLLWITLFISLALNGFPSHFAIRDTSLPRN